jgi:hypothetical protein
MRLEARKYLLDIQVAADRIDRFTASGDRARFQRQQGSSRDRGARRQAPRTGCGPDASQIRSGLISLDQPERFAAPPSIVTIVPEVYAERSDARNAAIHAISSGFPGRPNDIPLNSSS